MLRQLSSRLAMGLMLVAARHGGAQEMEVPAPEAVPPPAVIRVSPGYTLPYQRGCSLKRICQWLTYRPLPQPVPVCCQGPRCQTSALPPLYLYFIGEFGPRSPELAHMTGGFAAGGVYQGPMTFEVGGGAPPVPISSSPVPAASPQPIITRPAALPQPIVARPVMVKPVIRQVTTAAAPRPQTLMAKPLPRPATVAPKPAVSTRVVGREVIVPVSDTPGRPRWGKPGAATGTAPTWGPPKWGPPSSMPGAAPKAAVQPAAPPADAAKRVSAPAPVSSTRPVSAPTAPTVVPVKTAAKAISTPTGSGNGTRSGIIAGQLPPMPSQSPYPELSTGGISFHSASPEIPLHRVNDSSPAPAN